MTKNEKEIRAMSARGLRGGLNSEETLALCERLDDFFIARTAWLESVRTDIEHVIAEGLDGDMDPLADVHAAITLELDERDTTP